MKKVVLIFVKEQLLNSFELEQITKNLNEPYEIIINSRQSKLDDLERYKLAISLGGDGNLITCARLLSSARVPIIGVNGGNLGFLTEIKPVEFASFYEQYLANNYKIERPFLLSVRIFLSNGQMLQRYAFNDVVLNRDDRFLLADIRASFNNKIFNTYHADGLIISSPAGSTAYNMSAGGPIIYPLSRVFCMVPVCSHSLTQRPIVLPKSFFVRIDSANCSLSIDGHENYCANEFKYISVGLSNMRAYLIRRKERSYFAVLKDKLHWGEDD